MALTNHPHLVQRLKSRAIPVLPLWAFVAYCRVNFSFTFTFTVIFYMHQYRQSSRYNSVINTLLYLLDCQWC